MDFRIIIPARYDSTRLPGKVLLDIAGMPMIQHVYERSVATGADSVVIATDDDRIAAAAEKFGAPVCMTESDHQSGTERLAEAVIALDYDKEDVVVSVQADEPLIPPQLIKDLATDLLAHDHAKVATMAAKITNPQDLMDPHVVKVVLNHRSFAVYFSRAPIPWDREHFSQPADDKMLQAALTAHANTYYRHIGLYAFRADFLETYANWTASPLEEIESLEQLRVLWHGYKIHVGVTELEVPSGVDTQADLDVIRSQF